MHDDYYGDTIDAGVYSLAKPCRILLHHAMQFVSQCPDPLIASPAGGTPTK